MRLLFSWSLSQGSVLPCPDLLAHHSQLFHSALHTGSFPVCPLLRVPAHPLSLCLLIYKTMVTLRPQHLVQRDSFHPQSGHSFQGHKDNLTHQFFASSSPKVSPGCPKATRGCLYALAPTLLQFPDPCPSSSSVTYSTTSDKTMLLPRQGLQLILLPSPSTLAFFTLLLIHLRYQVSPFKDVHGNTQSTMPLRTSIPSSQKISLVEPSYLFFSVVAPEQPKAAAKSHPMGPLAALTSDGLAILPCSSS